MQKIVNVESCGIDSRLVVHEINTLDIIQNKDDGKKEKVLFHSWESQSGKEESLEFHFLNSVLFKNVKKKMLNNEKAFGKVQVKSNETNRNRGWSAVSIMQIYLEKAAGLMKSRALLMCPVHAMVLAFKIKLWQKIIRK